MSSYFFYGIAWFLCWYYLFFEDEQKKSKQYLWFMAFLIICGSFTITIGKIQMIGSIFLFFILFSYQAIQQKSLQQFMNIFTVCLIAVAFVTLKIFFILDPKWYSQLQDFIPPLVLYSLLKFQHISYFDSIIFCGLGVSLGDTLLNMISQQMGGSDGQQFQGLNVIVMFILLSFVLNKIPKIAIWRKSKTARP